MRKDLFMEILKQVIRSNGPAIADEDGCDRSLDFSFSLDEDSPELDVMVYFKFVEGTHFKISYVHLYFACHGEIELYDAITEPEYSFVEYEEDKEILLTCVTWIKEFIIANHGDDTPYVYPGWHDERIYPIQ